MLGKTNHADLFPKEDNNVQHFELLRDQMVMPQEAFSKLSLPSTQAEHANVADFTAPNALSPQFCFNPSTIFHQKVFKHSPVPCLPPHVGRSSMGVLKQWSSNQNSHKLTNLTKIQVREAPNYLVSTQNKRNK